MIKKRPMFVGPIGCGKTSIIQRLTHETFAYNKTQSVEFNHNYIDTPGEYIEHRRMYTHIATTAMDASVVVVILAANEQRLIFPEGFTTMFTQPIIGVVNKYDLVDQSVTPEALQQVEQQLKAAGVDTLIRVSAKDDTNIDQLADAIEKASHQNWHEATH